MCRAPPTWTACMPPRSVTWRRRGRSSRARRRWTCSPRRAPRSTVGGVWPSCLPSSSSAPWLRRRGRSCWPGGGPNTTWSSTAAAACWAPAAWPPTCSTSSAARRGRPRPPTSRPPARWRTTCRRSPSSWRRRCGRWTCPTPGAPCASSSFAWAPPASTCSWARRSRRPRPPPRWPWQPPWPAPLRSCAAGRPCRCAPRAPCALDAALRVRRPRPAVRRRGRHARPGAQGRWPRR